MYITIQKGENQKAPLLYLFSTGIWRLKTWSDCFFNCFLGVSAWRTTDNKAHLGERPRNYMVASKHLLGLIRLNFYVFYIHFQWQPSLNMVDLIKADSVCSTVDVSIRQYDVHIYRCLPNWYRYLKRERCNSIYLEERMQSDYIKSRRLRMYNQSKSFSLVTLHKRSEICKDFILGSVDMPAMVYHWFGWFIYPPFFKT